MPIPTDAGAYVAPAGFAQAVGRAGLDRTLQGISSTVQDFGQRAAELALRGRETVEVTDKATRDYLMAIKRAREGRTIADIATILGAVGGAMVGQPAVGAAIGSTVGSAAGNQSPSAGIAAIGSLLQGIQNLKTTSATPRVDQSILSSPGSGGYVPGTFDWNVPRTSATSAFYGPGM